MDAEVRAMQEAKAEKLFDVSQSFLLIRDGGIAHWGVC